MTTATFTGEGQSGDWLDPANWSTGAVPGATKTGLLENAGTQTFAGSASAGNIMLIGTEQVTFGGTVQAFDTGNCNGFMVCVTATATFAPGATLDDAGALLVGVHGVGGFTAEGTGTTRSTIDTANATIGKFATVADGTVTIDDATWNDAHFMFVGYQGAGTLDVLNGGSVMVGGILSEAYASGATGEITLSTGAEMNVAGWASLGGAVGTVTGGAAMLTVGDASTFDVGGSLKIGAAGTIDLAGGTVSGGGSVGWIEVAAGGRISGNGLLQTRANATVGDDGTIASMQGTLEVGGAISGTGTLQLGDGSTFKIDGAIVKLPTIAFIGGDATLSLVHGAHVTGEIEGFAVGDQILMAGVDHAVWNATSQVLTLSNAGHVVDRLDLSGSYGNYVFDVQQTSAGAVIGLQAKP